MAASIELLTCHPPGRQPHRWVRRPLRVFARKHLFVRVASDPKSESRLRTAGARLIDQWFRRRTGRTSGPRQRHRSVEESGTATRGTIYAASAYPRAPVRVSLPVVRCRPRRVTSRFPTIYPSREDRASKILNALREPACSGRKWLWRGGFSSVPIWPIAGIRNFTGSLTSAWESGVLETWSPEGRPSNWWILELENCVSRYARRDDVHTEDVHDVEPLPKTGPAILGNVWLLIALQMHLAQLICMSRAMLCGSPHPFQPPQKEQTPNQRDSTGEQHAGDHLFNVLEGPADTAPGGYRKKIKPGMDCNWQQNRYVTGPCTCENETQRESKINLR